jgi:hypothetical protein
MKGTRFSALAALVTVGLGTFAPEAAAAPTPITACRRITKSGSYVVTRNLTAAGDCLVLATNFVTVDLGGFTITGDGTGIGVSGGQVVVNPRGYVIRNGIVANFRRGVDVGFASSLIEGILALDNTEMGIGGGEGSIVRNNTARGSGEIGIQVLTGTLVTGNVVTATTKGSLGLGNGIVTVSSALVSGNISSFNEGHGIFVGCPSNVIGNTAVSNPDGNIETNPLTTGCNLEHNVAP